MSSDYNVHYSFATINGFGSFLPDDYVATKRLFKASGKAYYIYS